MSHFNFHLARPTRLLLAMTAALLSIAAGFAVAASAPAADTGWYTVAQATRGHQLFNNHCAQCHRPDLTGAAGPALIGKTFFDKWGNKPLSDLYAFEHQYMPAVNPGSVPPDQLWPITAYILQKNGFGAGSAELGNAMAGRALSK
jgi:mono/diheme cytochrome c family protein